MFNLFKKGNQVPLPAKYAGILELSEYNLVIDLCRKYFERVDQRILRIGDGEIVIDIGDSEMQHHLDNIVRILAQHDRTEWENLLSEHFGKSQTIPHATEYLYKDFEYAAQFIKVYIKHQDTFGDEAEDYVHRVDLPGTLTFLILDFNDKFHFVRREEARGWGKSDRELFEIGLSNISNEEINIEETILNNEYTLFTFFSGDFSATFIIEMDRNAGFAVGSFGSLVAIPTKGSAFIHPIENSDVLDVIAHLADITRKFFEEDPGNITTSFYWFHDSKFELFPTEPGEDGFVTINWPAELKQRLELK